MSYSQDIGLPGAGATPRVMREMFSQVLMLKGEPVMLYNKAKIVNCPCWNDIYHSADPSCNICKGTGNISGFNAQPSSVFKACIFFDSEMRQDQHQELVSRAGRIQTMDGRMYYEPRWYDIISIGDVIVYKPRGKTTGIELRVISKEPRTANNGEIIFVKSYIEKQPFKQVSGASVQETI